MRALSLIIAFSPCIAALSLRYTAFSSAMRSPQHQHRGNSNTALFSTSRASDQGPRDLKAEIRALKFCLRSDKSATPSDDIREHVLTYGFDDKRFLRSQLTLVREELLLHEKGLQSISCAAGGSRSRDENDDKVTVANWSSSLNKRKIKGDFEAITNGCGPNAEMQLSKDGQESNANAVYAEQDILSKAFKLSFDLKICRNARADSIYAFFGTSSLPATEFETGCGDGVIVALSVYDQRPRGIHLVKITSSKIELLRHYSDFHASGNWEDLTISYQPSTTDTWKVRRLGLLYSSCN
jgi:hypothetical protein